MAHNAANIIRGGFSWTYTGYEPSVLLHVLCSINRIELHHSIEEGKEED
ncbi:hypothetical protein SDC9_186916 [bioreactor metagenome]|uniref:Uncharacterized protein n=1 Tax=bioreactor metagenome TaxID=1076179 RepID=A0A645HK42_9ZZZZ